MTMNIVNGFIAAARTGYSTRPSTVKTPELKNFFYSSVSAIVGTDGLNASAWRRRANVRLRALSRSIVYAAVTGSLI